MARFSFGLFGQDTSQLQAGQEVKVKNEDTGQFIASTNPTGSQLQVVDNNDGTYYVDGAPLALLSVYVGSDAVPQEELQYIAFMNEDVIGHVNATAPHSGHATTTDLDNHKNDQTIHRQINDSGNADTDLWSAQKIENELSNKSDTSHEHSYVKDVDTQDFEKDANDQIGLKDRSVLDGEFISESESLAQNIRNLDDEIKSISQESSGNGGNGRVIYSDNVGDLSPSGSLAFDEYVCSYGTYQDARILPFNKISGDTTISVYLEMMHTNDGTANDGEEKVKIVIGSLSAEVACDINAFNSNYKAHSITLNIASLNLSDLHEIKIQMKNPIYLDGSLKMKKLQIIVQ